MLTASGVSWARDIHETIERFDVHLARLHTTSQPQHLNRRQQQVDVRPDGVTIDIVCEDRDLK